jgi:hypothetical protein
MRPGEPIHTGMQVWHVSGKTARVSCVIVAFPPPNVTVVGYESQDNQTYVRLTPDDQTQPAFDLILDMFVRNYHRRLTAWERLDVLNIEEPVYEGPVEGYLCIGSQDNASRIAKRVRASYESIAEERNILRAIGGISCGSYAEWFEKADPGAWKLVLDPAL